jgi:hypothetical protein
MQNTVHQISESPAPVVSILAQLLLLYRDKCEAVVNFNKPSSPMKQMGFNSGLKELKTYYYAGLYNRMYV